MKKVDRIGNSNKCYLQTKQSILKILGTSKFLLAASPMNKDKRIKFYVNIKRKSSIKNLIKERDLIVLRKTNMTFSLASNFIY
jgi:hypothetical protein